LKPRIFSKEIEYSHLRQRPVAQLLEGVIIVTTVDAPGVKVPRVRICLGPASKSIKETPKRQEFVSISAKREQQLRVCWHLLTYQAGATKWCHKSVACFDLDMVRRLCYLEPGRRVIGLLDGFGMLLNHLLHQLHLHGRTMTLVITSSYCTNPHAPRLLKWQPQLGALAEACCVDDERVHIPGSRRCCEY